MISTLRSLFPYLIRYRWRFAAGFAALVAKSVLTVGIPIAIKLSIDELDADFELAVLGQWVGLLLAIALIKGVFQYWMRWILIGISRDIEYDLRKDFFASLLSFSQRFYHSYRTGDLMSRATSDMEAVRLLVGPGIMYTADFALIFLGVLAVMSLTDWRLTCWIFIPIPVISFTVSFYGKRIHDCFQRVQECMGEMSSTVQEQLSNIRIVRAFAKQKIGRERFSAQNDQVVAENVKLIRLWGRFYPLLEVLIGLTYVIVMWLGGRRVLDGSMTLGSFAMFMSYMTVLTWPLIGFGWVVNLVQRGTASLARLDEILKQRPEIYGPGELDDEFTAVRGDLAFEHVTYAYPGSTDPAVSDINLVIPAGQTVAILGPTGSGKTTLANLVARLYDPREGRVLIDGGDVRELPLRSLRHALGFVPQDTFLFGRSIRDNIAFGALGSEEWEIAEAAEIAQIAAEVDSFPDRYETVLGERGVNLSGGQRQRVSIARALRANPRILVLDDAASSVDAETEGQILRNLESVMRNRTTLLITHRVSAARLADRIIVLESGRIVEEGLHGDLLAARGRYWDLSRKQQLEEELEIV
ncbi:MAG: ABC transporter ATP-binding protein [Acidobacteria bacterium]|nr:ABC transporter ATP-binding protein [Acidobacteriota bacterium]